jgi:hypothetical protein
MRVNSLLRKKSAPCLPPFIAQVLKSTGDVVLFLGFIAFLGNLKKAEVNPW